ncbi:hypothetical protein [Amycolatopsis anabasis]|uniref:hypothetical protein n=1 Tax=Amycolatopsis anabasis TaxID=1840409 RepID=UPI00131BC73F|nr:hypothetical protein [Amycolatopsis anabasis]
MQRVPAGPPPPRRGKPVVLKAAGLVVVAVVSGLVWWLIRHDDAADGGAGPDPRAQQLQFTTAEGPVVATDCAANAYGTTKKWFAEHPCKRVSRALYSVATDGARALVSVALVTMPAPEQAQELKALTEADNTGNVNDLVKDGTAKIAGAPKLATGQYNSQVTGADVTIVLAEFFDKHQNKALLQRISTEALHLDERLR